MGIEKYNEEEFNEWCEAHTEWMRKNLPVQMVESFENEIESLLIEQINDELRDYANTRPNR